MKFHIVSVKLTGNPDKNGWTQVHDFTPADPKKLLARGRLVAVICLQARKNASSQGFIEDVRLGREILSRLHEEYFANQVGSPLVCLKNAVDKVSLEFESSDFSLETVTLSLIERSVFVYGKGGVAGLFRDGLFFKLAEPLIQVKPVSGNVKVGDVYVLGSSQFFEALSLGVLRAQVSSWNGSGFPEVLAQAISDTPEKSLIGASFLKIEPEVFVKRKLPPESKKKPSWRPRLERLLDAVEKRLPEKKLIVGSDMRELTTSRRKNVSLAGFILLILLAISIVFGVRGARINNFRKTYESELSTAEHELAEASTLTDLNPQRARELLFASRERLKSLKEKEITDPKLNDLLALAEESMGKIAGVYESAEQTFLDLLLVSPGFEGSDLSYSGGDMRVLSESAQKLIKVNIETKRTEVIVGSDKLYGSYQIASSLNETFGLADDGVRIFEEEVALVIKPEDWHPRTSLISAFAGNVYVLDKEAGKIFRFVPSGTDYLQQEWLSTSTSILGVDPVSLSIDGAIWLLTNKGEVLKFSLGAPQVFSLKNMDKELTNPVDIFTSEDTKYLYLLDKGNKRILVINKESGSYKAQYVLEKLAEATHLAVSESVKKAVFLAGSKLFEIELKHLD